MLLGVRPWETWAQPDSASPHVGPVAGLVAKTMASHKPLSSEGEAGSLAASSWNPLAWLQIPAVSYLQPFDSLCLNFCKMGAGETVTPSTHDDSRPTRSSGLCLLPVASVHPRAPADIGLRTCEQLLQCFVVHDGNCAWVGRLGVLRPLLPFWAH